MTPIKECFTTLSVGSHGHVYLGNNHACSIEGIGTVHLSIDGINELVLHDVRYVPGIKKSLLSVGQMDMHGYSILFERGSWKMTKEKSGFICSNLRMKPLLRLRSFMHL